MRTRYIAVDGPIGVGKSALVDTLTQELKSQTFKDLENPFLQNFYEDMKSHAFQVQMFFLLNRFKQQQAIAQGDLFTQHFVSDYLFHKDQIFARLTLSPDEYVLYEKVYALLQGTIVTPDVIIYLQSDIDTLVKRISEKDERLSLRIPEDYLEKLVAAYQSFFFHYTEAPVIVCNTVGADFINDDENVSLLLRKIDEVKSGIYFLNPRT